MISNDNFFDISILRQVPEIGQFHQSSFTFQQPMLNTQQSSTGHSTHQRAALLSLVNLFCSEVCRHPSKMKTLFINAIEMPPTWAARGNIHKIGIQVYPPCLMSLSKNQKTFIYAIVVEVILPISTTIHQKKIIIKHVDRRVSGKTDIGNLLQHIIIP